MANLTLRQAKGSALTITELDGNFEYFTGSYTNTGIITAAGFIGSFTGSIASASYATQALSSSYALTATSASYATNATNALTASYINPLEQDIQLTGSLIVNEGYIANFPTNSINLTIPPGYNALLVGPIYNSASINISTGSRLVIL
jgi:hypothetical protein